MEVCLRRKQQHRAVRDIRARLDRLNLGHGGGSSLVGCLNVREIGDAQPRNVEGGLAGWS